MKNGNRHYYEKRLILVSLSCFGAAIYILFNSLIPSLVPIIPITGTVESSDIFIRNIEIRGTKTKEVKLTFNLKEFNKEFSFTQEIEQNYNNQKFVEISNLLNDSNSATIWIKSNKKNKRNPKIYQLDVDGETMIHNQENIAGNIPVLVLSLLLGTSSLLSVLKKRYPNKFQIFNNKIKPVANNGEHEEPL